jgi:DNA polymerase III subunit gamma/tau
MSQAFYRKWRPRQWDEVVAQEHVVQTLRNAVRTARTGHAYLLSGPRGTGKTTTARLLAKALNCLDEDTANRPCDSCAHCEAINASRFLDLIEIDAASNTSVDDVRDLREKINFSPTQGRCKVYIIDEVHMLSTAAFNALLKTLEEPPPHAIFILATTEVHKIPATILSRVQRYEFRRIPVSEIVKHLREKAAEEGLAVDEDALTLIARQATGAMRDAISLLDQLASTGERVTLAEAQVVLGTATSSMVVEMIEAVLAREAARGLQAVQAALDSGTDARQFARQVVDYLRNLLLVRMGNAEQVDATLEMRQQMAGHAAGFDTPRLLEAIRLFNSAAVDARISWHPGLGLELALAEAVEEKSAPVYQPAVTQSQPAAAQPRPAAGQAPPTPRSQPAAERSQPAAERSQPAADRSQPAAENPRTPAPPEEPPNDLPPSSVLYQQNQPQARAQGQPAHENPVAKPPAAQEQAQPGGKNATQNDIQQNWQRIKQMVRKRNPLTDGLLNSCRYSVKDNMLVLSFQSEVVKLKMDTPENLEIIRSAIQAVLGGNLNVRCIVGSGSANQPTDLNVDGNSMVGTALDMGGKIVYEEPGSDNPEKRDRR